MPIFTFNTFTISKKHFFKIFDKKARKYKISLVFLIVLYLYCFTFPVSSEYFNLIKSGSKFQGIDNLFDYTVPLLAALSIFYTFLADYKNNLHILFKFYESKPYNVMILYRWLLIVGTFSIGAFVSHIMYFRNVTFLEWQSVWMALLKLPNLLFLCAIVIFFMTQFSNAYIGLFAMLAYYVFDYISAGRTLAYISLGAHSNNFYFQNSPTLYFTNRIVLVAISITLVLLASRKHSFFNLIKLFRR